MNINDLLYGFRVTDICDIASIDAKIHLFEHGRTGARLCYIARRESSRTFAITFKTPPTDDTGVFHILEHSVLCGSEKFPTKEPFTEILKGSLNTFLNAMTYSDRTCYPVSSRCDKDFYNLVDVYLDAVFNPLAVKDERIFRQEGWRYEADEDGVEYNGVVYSEMKGAYSSADELAAHYNAKLLFPGGTYSYDSGGYPDAIPSLSYSDFVEAHQKHYHPSGAYIFLDGEPRLDEILPLIDSYLSRYERRDIDLPILRGGDVITEPLYERYEIGDGEDATDKTRLYLTYVGRECSDTLSATMLSVITDAVADSNEAPLKKAVLAAGLCDNVYVYPTPGCMWSTYNVEFRGVKDGREAELIAHFDKCTTDMLDGGIDRALLSASADRIEFKAREADFGSSPKGIVYLSAVNDLWIYGIHPKHALDYEESFRELRSAMKTEYPERLLGDILKGPRATLVLTPSKELAKERDAVLDGRLKDELAAMSEDERSLLPMKTAQFAEWQSRQDTPEALATIPALSLDDLGEGPAEVPIIVDKYKDSTLIDHPIATSGITYVGMYFDASDTDTEDLGALALLSLVYSNLDTTRGSANDFRRRAKSALGSISLTLSPAKRADEPKLYAILRYSCLDKERATALDLAMEYLYSAILDNPAAVKRALTQYTATYADLIIENGHSIALTRSAARHSRLDAIKEHTSGYELYRWLKRHKDADDGGIGALIERMKALHSRIFVRERLTLSLTGKSDAEYSRKVVDRAARGTPSAPSKIKTLPIKNEGIAIPSQVSYAALAGNINSLPESEHSGAWSTLASLLDFEILWDEVRVKGGAYGVGFVSRANSGTTAFYSYRDPAPAHTLDVYRIAPDLIRARLSEDINLDQLIIGTVGASEPITTPATDGSSATLLYLSGKSHADTVRSRRECIATTKEKLKELSYELDRIIECSSATVVGPKDGLLGLGLDEILEI